MNEFRPFVDYFILYVNTLTYRDFSENNTVSYNSTFFNDASTTDYGILNSTFNLAAVGDYGILHICSIEILSRAGIIGTCIDWPVIMEKFLS